MGTIERLKQLNELATAKRWTHDQKGNIFTIANLPADEQFVLDEGCDKRFVNASLVVEMRNSIAKLLAFVEAYDAWQSDFYWNGIALQRKLNEARKSLEENHEYD